MYGIFFAFYVVGHSNCYIPFKDQIINVTQK